VGLRAWHSGSFTLVISATLEAEIWRIEVQEQPRQKVRETKAQSTSQAWKQGPVVSAMQEAIAGQPSKSMRPHPKNNQSKNG
jgi:hypothetical protein